MGGGDEATPSTPLPPQQQQQQQQQQASTPATGMMHTPRGPFGSAVESEAGGAGVAVGGGSAASGTPSSAPSSPSHLTFPSGGPPLMYVDVNVTPQLVDRVSEVLLWGLS